MALQTRSEATLINIMTAAASLFTAKNYADVTMDQIAEAAHVTKGALYHHFSSKQDLYLALMHADLAEKRRLFTQAVSSPGTCRQRLRRLTSAFLLLPPESRELIKLVRRDINTFREPVRSELVRAYQAALPEVVERVVLDGMTSGELRSADPRLLSWHFVAMVEITLGRYAQRIFRDTDERLDYVLDLFFSGAEAEERRNPR